MEMILTKWDKLINETLNPFSQNINTLTDELIKTIIADTEAEKAALKATLIKDIINTTAIKDKEQYVHITQALLIRMLNKIYTYRKHNEVNGTLILLYDTITQSLQLSLDFIEEFFAGHFNQNERVPESYLASCKTIMAKQLMAINLSITANKLIDTQLASVIEQHLQGFINNGQRPVSYLELLYHKDLLRELISEKTMQSTQTLRELLYYLNYNEENFISYEYERLQLITGNLPTKKEQVITLRFEQKTINQLSGKITGCYSLTMPPLKEQVNGWINEEIKFLEAGNFADDLSTIESENKIHTSLSVAKLALIIRLLVIDKIIINRTVAPMLRIVARVFTSLQKEDISFGSLETKYHAPDKATINAVKEILFKWINILNRL